MSDPEPPSSAQRIDLLERTLREIVALAVMHPQNEAMQHAKVLAKSALDAVGAAETPRRPD